MSNIADQDLITMTKGKKLIVKSFKPFFHACFVRKVGIVWFGREVEWWSIVDWRDKDFTRRPSYHTMKVILSVANSN